MSDSTNGTDRRTLIQILGASGLLGTVGYASANREQDDQEQAANEPHGSESETLFERIPAVDIPVIDAYYEGDVVWFVHTDVSDEEMATRLTEMIDYPTHHTPALAEAVNLDAAAPIYVFTNGVDRSDAEPWGGGPFGFQIDVVDTVPGDEGYTSIRNPKMVTWNDDADPEILASVDQIQQAQDDGRLTIQETDVAVTAPIVSWSDGPDDPHTSRRSTRMEEGNEGEDEMQDGSNDSDATSERDKPETK